MSGAKGEPFAGVSGEVPADYDGPIYYRFRAGTREPKAANRYIRFDNPEIGQRLSSADRVQVAHCLDPRLFDGRGKLLPILQGTLRATLASDAPKRIPEWALGPYLVVSPRVKAAIERLQPDKQLCLPIDLQTSEGVQRLYAFYVLRSERRSAIALSANRIPFEVKDGRTIFSTPSWVRRHEFAYLRADVIGSRVVDYDAYLGLLVSERLLDELGDVFPKGIALVPMGVAHEPPYA